MDILDAFDAATDRDPPAAPAAGAPPLNERHGSYRLRFARDERDVLAAQRLRFDVFHAEMGEGLPENAGTGLDRDVFDAQCDHLLVEDAIDGRVVGTYRLQTLERAARGAGFYSDAEFELGALGEDVLASSVELGRACVARSHRNRAVLFLLWRGLGAYLLHHRKHSFFGCSSLTSTDPCEGTLLHRRLVQDGKLRGGAVVRPRAGYECGPCDCGNTRVPRVPPLFSTYLRHGAVMCSLPALDRAFGTIDFLTLLDVRRMERKTFRAFVSGLAGAPPP